MKQSEIFSKISIILQKKLNRKKSEITLSANLSTDLGADSLDLVEIVMEIKTTFDIKISDEEVGMESTVQNLVDLVEKKLTEKGAIHETSKNK